MKKNFMTVQFDWIDNNKYRNVMCSCKGIQLVYDLMRKYVIRDRLQHKVSQYIFDNFYSKGILASSVTYNFLVETTGMGKATVAKCISNLVDAGYVEIQKTASLSGEEQNVYALGRRRVYTNTDGKEIVCDYWKIDDLVCEDLMNTGVFGSEFKN